MPKGTDMDVESKQSGGRTELFYWYEKPVNNSAVGEERIGKSAFPSGTILKLE